MRKFFDQIISIVAGVFEAIGDAAIFLVSKAGKSPIFVIAVIAFCMYYAITSVGGIVGWYAEGASSQAVSFVVAGALGIGLARLIRHLSILLPDSYSRSLHDNPVARAIAMAGIWTFCGLCVLATFGG